jgi:hypothetical protein
MSPERDPEASKAKEGIVDEEQMLVTNQQAAKLTEPDVSSLHNPSPLVAAELASIFVARSFAVCPVRRNQFNASLLEPLAQGVGAVRTTFSSTTLSLSSFEG